MEPLSAHERERRLRLLRVRFLKRATKELVSVAQAGPRGALERAAHNLRGTGAALGLEELAREAGELESAIGSQAPQEELDQRLEQLRATVRRDLARA